MEDGTAFFKRLAAVSPSDDRRRFDVVVVDCFTPDGVAPGVADGSMLSNMSKVLREGGLCIVNLHTAPGKAPHERNEAAAGRAMDSLAQSFSCVHRLEARSCRNVLALCHQGTPPAADEWHRMVKAVLEQGPETCPDITADDFVAQLQCVHHTFLGAAEPVL